MYFLLKMGDIPASYVIVYQRVWDSSPLEKANLFGSNFREQNRTAKWWELAEMGGEKEGNPPQNAHNQSFQEISNRTH